MCKAGSSRGSGGEAEAVGEVQPRWRCDAAVIHQSAAFHQSAKGAVGLKCQ